MANRQTALALHFGDAVTDVGTTQLYPLGTRREEEGKVYRYVKNVDATVTMVANDLVYHDGTTTNTMWQVNGDLSDVDSAFAAGVAQGVIANAGYGWIGTKGNFTVKKKTGTAAFSWIKGDAIIASGANATDDGRAQRAVIAAATKVSAAELRAFQERVIGYAIAAATKTAASGTVYVELE